jgi:nucleotide-binding universal stress UspA family protein
MARNIIAAVDFSDATSAVVARAAELANALGAKLWLIHVATPQPDFMGYEVGPVYIRDSVAQQLRMQHKHLHRMRQELHAQGVEASALLVSGTPARKIILEASRLEAEFIVMGSHGHGTLFNLLMGTVCNGVLRKAPCPVVVVPARTARQPQTVGAQTWSEESQGEG